MATVGLKKIRIPTDPHLKWSVLYLSIRFGGIYIYICIYIYIYLVIIIYIRVFSHSQMLRYKHLSKWVVLLNFVAHQTSSRLAYFVSIKFVQTTAVWICRANWASAATALVHHLHSDMEDAGVWSPKKKCDGLFSMEILCWNMLHSLCLDKFIWIYFFWIYFWIQSHCRRKKIDIFTSPFKWIVPLWPGSLPYPGKHFQHGGPNRYVDLWAEGWHYCRRDR